MTGILTDLMHHCADHLEAPELDVSEITRNGESAVRRRRTAVVGGVAAAAVVAATAGTAVLSRGGSDAPVADGTSATAQPLTWTTGRTLHTANGSPVELAADVRAWVLAGDAVAYTDTSHRVHLSEDGADRIIGATANPVSDIAELVSDGTLVAWVAPDRRVVRYDAESGSLIRGPELPGDDPRVTAMDGPEVYAADTTGIYAWRSSTPGSYRTLDTDPRAVVLDAESGTLVRAAPDRTVLFERDGTTIEVSSREFADLSPDGRLLSLDNKDVGQVVVTATGDQITLDHGHEWAIGYQWLDPTTVAVLAFDGVGDEDSMDGWLLTCDGTTGDCAPAEHLPAVGDFQLPVGLHLGS